MERVLVPALRATRRRARGATCRQQVKRGKCDVQRKGEGFSRQFRVSEGSAYGAVKQSRGARALWVWSTHDDTRDAQKSNANAKEGSSRCTRASL